jgi:hypothetical protein
VFLKYDNILAFNIGNEVIASANETNAAPFVKAAARDIKAYLSVHIFLPIAMRLMVSLFYFRSSKGSSALVGYAGIDGDDDFVVPLASYLACDPSGSNSGADAIDLYGLNN